MPFPPRAELMPSDACATFASWQNLLIIFSFGPETGDTFDLCERNLSNLLRKQPSGAGILLFVMHSEKAPEDYAHRTAKLLGAHRSQIRCSTAVIEGRGFTGAAQRALGNSIITLSGMRSVIGMFSAVEEASPFIVERILPAEHRALGQVALVEAVNVTRAEVVARKGRGLEVGVR